MSSRPDVNDTTRFEPSMAATSSQSESAPVPFLFGPSAIATYANAVTLLRVAVTPVLLVWIVTGGSSWPAFVLWAALASTDGVDGYIARRYGTTRSGAFLDPLADKFLVLGAMTALVSIEWFSWVPVALIAFREVSMSAYRSYVSRRGVSIPARLSAKVKTVVQVISVGFALMPPVADAAPEASVFVLWVSVVLTLGTGVQYLRDGWKPLHAM